MKCSVLLITYNHSKYISQAIDSILHQRTNYSWELVLLDDASTDDTFEIATDKLRDVPHCRMFRNETNLGITRNYQKAFSLCGGEYLFVLEGDDYWIDSDKMEKQISFMEAHPLYSLCFHHYLIQAGETSVFTKNFKTSDCSSFDTFSILDLLHNEGLIGNYSICCYRKKWIDSLPHELFNVLSYDWIMNMYMGHFGLLGRINQVMSVYRHAEGATWSKKTRDEALSKMLELLPTYNSLLNFKYDNHFKEKEITIRKKLRLKNSLKSRLKLWLPPIIIQLYRLIVPPIFKKNILI